MVKRAARFPAGVFGLLLLLTSAAAQTRVGTSWTGVLRDAAGNPAPGASINLHSPKTNAKFSSTSTSTGAFSFQNLPPGDYDVSVHVGDASWTLAGVITVNEATTSNFDLQLSPEGHELRAVPRQDSSAGATGGSQASGGERVNRRPAGQETRIIRRDGLHGRLLQHDLRQPDAVRLRPFALARPPSLHAPRQHPGVAVVPGQEVGRIGAGFLPRRRSDCYAHASIVAQGDPL